MNIQLLIIDPQRDFCDPNGSLYVKGAEKDIDRLALMLKRIGDKFDDIHITLDSHHYFDVAHPVYWVDSKGNHPKPFTLISVEDVENGTWAPAVPELFNRSLEYVRALKAGNRYALVIWPPHCLISSEGSTVMPNLFNSLLEWETKPAIVNKVTKGSNPYTEHYSVFRSEVVDDSDPTTQLNTDLIKALVQADVVLIAGEASSHCVANSVIDLANNFGSEDYVKKLVFLKDASSPVTGFENLEEKFLKEMTARGMKVATTDTLPF